MEQITKAQADAQLGSPEGKKLIAMLQQDGGKRLRQAAAAAKAGDTETLEALIGPEGKRLAQTLSGQLG